MCVRGLRSPFLTSKTGSCYRLTSPVTRSPWESVRTFPTSNIITCGVHCFIRVKSLGVNTFCVLYRSYSLLFQIKIQWQEFYDKKDAVYYLTPHWGILHRRCVPNCSIYRVMGRKIFIDLIIPLVLVIAEYRIGIPSSFIATPPHSSNSAALARSCL